MRRALAIAGASLVLAGAGGAGCGSQTAPTSSSAPPPTATQPARPPSVVTQANFDKIVKGMTYAQVVEILGPPNAKTTDIQSPGTHRHFESFSWKDVGANSNRSISVGFTNGVVDTKYTYGWGPYGPQRIDRPPR